eukprot:scaffold14.g1328.t1
MEQLSALPPDTAASIVQWLCSRGRDIPIHLPRKTLALAREVFTLIDVDRSGTLEPAELLSVFHALGQTAVTLDDVRRLVAEAAGSECATCLTFTSFAQLFAGAAGQLQDAAAGSAADIYAPRGSSAAPSPRDLHLLAAAYRRRIVLSGVIDDRDGWRQKVQRLAERQEQTRQVATASAAATWRARALQRANAAAEAAAAGGAAAAAAAMPDAVAASAASPPAMRGGGRPASSARSAASGPVTAHSDAAALGEDLLAGAVSVGSTPRGQGGPQIVTDSDSPRYAPCVQRGQTLVELLRQQIHRDVQQWRMAARQVADAAAPRPDREVEIADWRMGPRMIRAVAGEARVVHAGMAPGSAANVPKARVRHSPSAAHRAQMREAVTSPARHAQQVRLEALARIRGSGAGAGLWREAAVG